MRKIVLPLVLLAAFAMFVGVAAAQEGETTVSAVNGTIVGDRGGTHTEWTAEVPANTDVHLSVEYSPCGDASAIALMVYSNDGQVTKAVPDGHCRKTAKWNTAGSNMATIKLSNYLHGIALYYVMASKGFAVTDATLVSTTGEVKAAVEAAEGEAAAEADAEMAAKEAAVVETLKANAAEGSVLGTKGGGHSKYEVDLEAGGTHAVLMHYMMDVGGTWPAVGFQIWGPDGSVVATGKHRQHGPYVGATFVPAMAGTYTVDVYNYHPGHTMGYTITGMPVPEATEGAETPTMEEEEVEA